MAENPVIGHLLPTLPELLDVVQRGDNRDPAIFALFADLADRAGRGDLADEFRRRAESLAPVATATPLAFPASTAADRGLELLREGTLADTEAALREAVRLDPKFAVAHTNLGVALARQKRFAEAEAAFHLVVRLDPTASGGYANLGSACLDRGKWAEAEVWFRQAVHVDPAAAEPTRIPAWVRSFPF